MNDNPNSFGSKLELIKASDIKPKQVRWLWYPYIPFGKVTLLQGDPGDGKSKLMLSLAALLSKGAQAVDGLKPSKYLIDTAIWKRFSEIYF